MPTWATGAERSATPSPCRRDGRPPQGRLGGGFTLIELIVALAVVGAILAVAPVAIQRASASLGYRAAVRDVLASMREARQLARAVNRPVAFVVAPERRQFGIEGRPLDHVADDLRIAATTATALVLREGEQRIVFLPDGSSSGGSVEIVRAQGQGVRLRVDWLLGRITQEAAGT